MGTSWIPAFAGMTGCGVRCTAQQAPRQPRFGLTRSVIPRSGLARSVIPRSGLARPVIPARVGFPIVIPAQAGIQCSRPARPAAQARGRNPIASRTRAIVAAAISPAVSAPLASASCVSAGSALNSTKRRRIGASISATASAQSFFNWP